MRVAFQGEPGAYSEEAAVVLFGDTEVLPCRSLREVFAAVLKEQADVALVPIENSLAGSIHETYDLLVRSPLHITGEVMLRIDHCLLALPGQELHAITKVLSHPQALAQCDEFLYRLGVELVATYDTAGSARAIRQQELRGCAAVASRRASVTYGLDILRAGIQTYEHNCTRFYALGRQPAPRDQGPHKTVLAFTAEHRPAALYWCLGCFACRQLNLLKLESRPVRTRPWEYMFYLDIEGHQDDIRLAQALEELALRATSVRVLGSFARWQEG